MTIGLGLFLFTALGWPLLAFCYYRFRRGFRIHSALFLTIVPSVVAFLVSGFLSDIAFAEVRSSSGHFVVGLALTVTGFCWFGLPYLLVLIWGFRSWLHRRRTRTA